MAAPTYSQLQLVVVVLVAATSFLSVCTALSFDRNIAFVMPVVVRTSITSVIYECMSDIPRAQNIPSNYVLSYEGEPIQGFYAIRATLMYFDSCNPHGEISGEEFYGRCDAIVNAMVDHLSETYDRVVGFPHTAIIATDGPVRVQYTVERIHDELTVISGRPSRGFISPTVPDLSEVKVIRDVGPLSLHGSLDVSNAGQFTVGDCPMGASTLVGSGDINTEALTEGEYLVSPGNTYRLVMQDDCNLVMYSTSNDNIVTFATGTNGQGRNCYVRMQLDCNLVVYDGSHKPLWASDTDYADYYTGCLLSVDDAGTITIWASSQKADKTVALWAL